MRIILTALLLAAASLSWGAAPKIGAKYTDNTYDYTDPQRPQITSYGHELTIDWDSGKTIAHRLTLHRQRPYARLFEAQSVQLSPEGKLSFKQDGKPVTVTLGDAVAEVLLPGEAPIRLPLCDPVWVESYMRSTPSSYDSPSMVLIEYPRSYDVALNDTIRHWMADAIGVSRELTGDPNRMLDSWVGDMKRAIAAGDSMVRYIEIHKVYENPRCVSFTISDYGYEGGAHGYGALTGVTFRKADGSRLALDEYDPQALRPLLVEGLRKYFKVDSDQELAQSIDINPATLAMPVSQPYLTAEGIVFTYLPYEIAPYCYGSPTVVVPLDKAAAAKKKK